MKYSDLLKSCRLCNRFCEINRLEGQLGVCKANDKVKILCFIPIYILFITYYYYLLFTIYYL